jgi:hypothetical protein
MGVDLGHVEYAGEQGDFAMEDGELRAKGL